MKAKIYVGAKKYALYIGRKIVEKTLEFLTLPTRFLSKHIQDLKQYLMYGQSVQDGIPTPTTPIEVESVGDRTKNLLNVNGASLNGFYTATGNFSTSPNQKTIDKFKIKPNTNYVLSSDYDSKTSGTAYWRMCLWDKDGVFISRNTTLVAENISFNSRNAEYLSISPEINVFDYHMQLEEGTQSTSYEPYGYKVPVVVSGGKNLFNKNNLTSGYINISGKIVNTNTWEVSEFIKVLPNTNYTLSGVVQIYADIYHAFYDKDKNPISVVPVKVGITQLTSPANAEYIRLSIRIASYDKETVQLEQGSTATDYVPYSSTTTNIYLDEPLRKLGEYADYIDFENQKVVRNIGYVKNVQYIGSKDSTGKLLQCISPPNIPAWTISTEKFNMISTYYENASLYYSRTGSGYYVVRYGGAIWIRDVDLLPVAVSQQDIEVGLCYQLSTPIEEQITLPAISLPQGTVTIDTETNIKPSKIIITGDIDNE